MFGIVQYAVEVHFTHHAEVQPILQFHQLPKLLRIVSMMEDLHEITLERLVHSLQHLVQLLQHLYQMVIRIQSSILLMLGGRWLCVCLDHRQQPNHHQPAQKQSNFAHVRGISIIIC